MNAYRRSGDKAPIILNFGNDGDNFPDAVLRP
jgi:hypothetical protein